MSFWSDLRFCNYRYQDLLLGSGIFSIDGKDHQGLFCSYPFDAQGIVPGRILASHSERLIRMQFVDFSLHVARNLADNSIIVAGDWYPILDNDLFNKPNNAHFFYSFNV